MFLLGYDIGSSSVKASLVNAETGKCVSSAFFPKTEATIPDELIHQLVPLLPYLPLQALSDDDRRHETSYPFQAPH